MIQLNIQLKLIVFSFIFGFFFAIILSKYNNYIKSKKLVLKLLITFILFLFLDTVYFIGIFIISNAIFHVYSLISILLGITVYNAILRRI